MGDVYIKRVKLLYGCPKAAVLTNGNIFNPFRILSGTRQGCPLAPLIFALASESLALAIRNHVNIKSIVSGQEHKLLLCVNDILLLSSNPEIAVPHILSMICSFSRISGYKTNWLKFEAMHLSKICPPSIRNNWQFKWLPSGLVYRGIMITPGLKDVMNLNLLPLVQKTESNLQNWSKLGLLLIGKIHLLKMITIPQINYVTSMLPLDFPLPPLSRFNRAIDVFLWMGMKPNFRETICISRGGWSGMPKNPRASSFPHPDWR